MEASSNRQPNPRGDYCPAPTSADRGDQSRLYAENQRQSMKRQPFSDRRHDGQIPPTGPLDNPSSALDDTQRRADWSRMLLQDFENLIFCNIPLERDDEILGPVRKHLIVDFASLQKMRLRKLQTELVDRVMTMHYKEEEPDDWEVLLKEYITAVRDYEYAHTSVLDHKDRSPFIISSSKAAQAKLLELALLHIPQECRESKGDWSTIRFLNPEYLEWDCHFESYLARRRYAFRQTLQRLVMSIVGGAFLIGPMWLMVLQNELYTTLITTTAFVFGFGLVLSLVPTFVDGARVGMDTVMSATAAYAAVLVVFVGTTLPTTTSGS